MEIDQLIFEGGPRQGQSVELSERPLVFGRNQGVDVVLENNGISRQHARLTWTADGYQLADLGSLNGTYINDQRLEGPKLLADGDRVRLGPEVVLRLVLAPKSPATVMMPSLAAALAQPLDQAAVPAPGNPPAPQPQPARLTISLPGGQTIEKTLTAAEIRLGRLEDNDIVVNVPIVSRRHFRLRQQGGAYVLVVEPNVANPVIVNGVPVQGQQTLQDKDQIVLGYVGGDMAVTLAYHAAETPSPAGAGQTVNLSARTPAPPADVNATQLRRPERATAPFPPDNAQNQTMIGDARLAAAAIPQQLVVSNFGKPPVVYTLNKDRLSIGRNADNDIVLDNPFVSRFQAELVRRGEGYTLVPAPAVANPVFVDGHAVAEATPLQHGAKLRIGGSAPGEMVSLVYLSPADEASQSNQQIIEFSESKVLSIGRDQQNDIVLNAPSVSRVHAQVERIGQRFRVKDLGSSNGTFVNGQRIKELTWVTPGDALYIGPYRLQVDEQRLTQIDQSDGGMRVEARDLQKWVRKDLNVLQNISLVFQPKEFIVVVGQSGGGKSTLVDAIAGYRPATHGSVIVNETIDVYKNFDAIRATIGYVPQKDIIHMELTVFQALDYAAQLRMPADTTTAERHQRIGEVMEELDLAHRRDTQISQLSGGQQKRVSIGVELLNKPGLFFLDEPTSGLDPATETELMHLMRRLADQGRTIVLITHATKNVMLADRVVFLARGGYLAWFGPPDEALAYFDQYRSDRERRTEGIEFDTIYNLLDRPEQGSPADWAERYRQHAAFQKYIVQPLGENKLATLPAKPAVPNARPKRQSVSALRQFFILSARNINILVRDRPTLALMLLLAPLMGSLDFVLAYGVGRNPFSYQTGDFNHVLVSLIMLTNTAILVGGLTMARELIKEREIYKRERMVNLHLSSYITSKLWFALLLALFQSFWFTLLRHLAFDMPGGPAERLYFFITVFLMVVGGMMIGLFTSAVAPNANAAPLILTMFILPQVVLSGALVPLPDAASATAVSRWAFQGAIAISGMGSDVAADPCWNNMTAAQRKGLTRAQKDAQCKCLGINAVREASCKFPGLGQYYDPAIDAPAPVKPAEPGSQPQSPVFPDAPQKPSNLNDPQAMQAYLKALDDYNAQVTLLRNKFNDELKAYGDTTDAYKTAINTYQTKATDYETTRATAVGSAEAVITRFYTDYGWTFVNQNDRAAYLGTLLKTWLAQLAIITVFFIGTVIAQKSQDVR